MLGGVRNIRYIAFVAVLIFLIFTLKDYILASGTVRFGSSGGVIPLTDSKAVWRNLPVRYPVKKITPLPSGKPLKLPKVQYDFPPEDESAKEVRCEHQAAVKEAFTRCWKSYREHAWMSDELAPLSGGRRNHFGGWAATLVDSLDTLWIMDLKDDFEEAIAAAVSIDFSASSLEEINVFETTIRYLGGLLAAYDLSGDKRLLEKAVELGDMLIVAFDTPNRLPITRWKVQNARKLQPQAAHSTTLVAEIGSLNMEFTRLAQVTGDDSFYDATDRIMRLFDQQQNMTNIPGMWPVVVNAFRANFTEHSTFTLGAMADSLYEYFPKMYALLGGLEPMYEKMYRQSMESAIEHTLFKPMTPYEADILVSGLAYSDAPGATRLDHQGQHLVCFAGGMFALGGKLFDIPHHLEIGKKLTDGCIWSYKAMPLEIMPEVFHMSACPALDGTCKWSEAKWHQDISVRKGLGQSAASEVTDAIKKERLVEGFTDIQDRRYILRPEAIESVFIMYRITGRKEYLENAWEMFSAIQKYTKTALANGAMTDVSVSPENVAVVDSMESFWLAETLKVLMISHY